MAEWMLLCTPVHSNASFKGVPAISLTFAATSLGLQALSIRSGFIPGISFLAKSRRLWNKSVITMGSAPAARADKSDTRPIGPAPLHVSCVNVTCLENIGQREWTDQISTESPSRRSALSMPANATDNGSQSAPSSKLTVSGRR